MNGRVYLAGVVVVLALGAGVAVAATQTTASGGTNVCVNSTNGFVRVASTCRDGEYPLTIGGGGNTQVTQNGTFTEPAGETGTGKVLPLTGATVSGRCDLVPSPLPGFSDGIVALAVVEAASGKTMDIFTLGGANPVGRSSAVIATQGGAPPGIPNGSSGSGHAILTSNGATATITVGGYGDPGSKTCTFLWQAVEAPN